MSLLSVDDLTLRIGAKEVLHGVSLGLDPGEILALTGESGSGKSMTAFSVMGLLPQGAVPAGAIRLDGTDLLRLSEREMCRFRGQAMGMVFQEPMTALNPVQRIGDQVAETLRVHGTPRARPRPAPPRPSPASASTPSASRRRVTRTSSRAGSASGSGSRWRWHCGPAS